MGVNIFEGPKAEKIATSLETIADHLENLVSPEAIAEDVAAWMDEHIIENPTVVIDDSLLIRGAAADAKKTGDEISDLKSALQDFRFNQLFVNGDFKDASGWKTNGSPSWTLSASDNVLTGTVLSRSIELQRLASYNDYPKIIAGHKYFCSAEYYGSDFERVGVKAGNAYRYGTTTANTWNRIAEVLVPKTVSGSQSDSGVYVKLVENYTVTSIKFRNVWMTDLTVAFGEGNEPTANEFLALFGESYYPNTDIIINAKIDKYVVDRVYNDINGVKDDLDVAGLIYHYSSQDGYVNTSGGISSPNSERLEKTTNKIQISVGDTIGYIEKHTDSHELWVAYALYDSTQAFISDSRTVLYNSNNSEYKTTVTIENPNAKYVVFSFRTYGDCHVTLFNPIEEKLDGRIDQLETDVDELQSEVANSWINQLIVNGNFESATGWKFNGAPSWTASASDNILTGTVSSNLVYLQRLASLNDYPNIIPGHKYYVNAEYYGSDFSKVSLYIGKAAIYGALTDNVWNKIAGIIEPYATYGATGDCQLRIELIQNYTVASIKVKNFWVTDLTEMFGKGNEPTAEEFALMFSELYYPYSPIKENHISLNTANNITFLSAYAKNEGRFKPGYDHLFVNNSSSRITIPHESVYHVRLSKRFGFDIIEANIQETSDGVYFVNHLGSNGTFGDYFQHVDGTTNISSMKPSEKTWEWIVENVRYTSSIPKYRNRPCTLREFLIECRQQNIIPLAQIKNQEMADIVTDIMGKDNFIAYTSNDLFCPTAMRMAWMSENTKSKIVEYCEMRGRPFIYNMANPTSFTDAQLSEIVEELHKRGFFIATAYNDQNWSKYSAIGFDFVACMGMVNRIPSGNLYNYDSTFGFDQFIYTNASEVDGKLVFSGDGTISPNVEAQSYSVAMFDIQLSFDGTVTIGAIGEQTSNLEYTSDGNIPVFIAIPVINGGVKPIISVASGTTINDITFRASIL